MATNTAITDQNGSAASDKPYLLSLADIQKSFGPVRALRGVSIDIAPGEVHAIVGENGAGKSTLIATAAGVIAADSGTLRFDGQSLGVTSVELMRRLGLAVVYQHHSLVPDLTVLENLQLAAEDLRGADGTLRASAILSSVHGPKRAIPLSMRVSDLTLAEAHFVEIARALATNPKLVFFDEPTEPFQEEDVSRLFEIIDGLRRSGVAVVYVSHRLHEVQRIADRISVLRDGEMVDSRLASDITRDEIVALIAGRPLTEIFPQKAREIGLPVLEVSALSGAGFDAADLTVRAGEIIGLAGVEGEGQREFLRAVAGVAPRQGGMVSVEGSSIPPGASAARRGGIGFVSDDRHAEGLFLPLSIRENIGIGAPDRFSRSGVIDPAEEAKLASSYFDDLRVKASSTEATVDTLSGGNQQKVFLARTLAAEPRVILIDEPTKGVDIGSRSEIYYRLRDLADAGVAVVVLSSDGVELEGLCDRVFVFSRGRIVQELNGSDVNDAAITRANLSATGLREQDEATDWRNAPMRRLFSSDHFPAAILVGLCAVFLGVVASVEPSFVSAYNLSSVTVFVALLTLISVGQLMTILVGGIDLSVGALTGLTVIFASFLLPVDASAGAIASGAALILSAGAFVGLVHGVLVTIFNLPAIIVTLASLIGLQGLSLILRPTPGGMITYAITDTASFPVLGVPAVLILVLLIVLGLEFMLFRTALGRAIRAVGSSPSASQRIGIRSRRLTIGAFVASGIFAAAGGLILAGQIGIGSPGIGLDYSIMSITAVVIGGAAVGGGRGSLICTFLGAALVQLLSSGSSFLNAGSSVHWLLLGSVTLMAAIFFSVARSTGSGR